jgi:hypothetical protein
VFFRLEGFLEEGLEFLEFDLAGEALRLGVEFRDDVLNVLEIEPAFAIGVKVPGAGLVGADDVFV